VKLSSTCLAAFLSLRDGLYPHIPATPFSFDKSLITLLYHFVTDWSTNLRNNELSVVSEKTDESFEHIEELPSQLSW